jgi:hypothetical protein
LTLLIHLVHAGALPRLLRGQVRAAERLVDIGGDRARLVQHEIAVLQDRSAPEGVPRQVLRRVHLVLGVVEPEGHALLGQDQPHDVDVRAALESEDGHVSHG